MALLLQYAVDSQEVPLGPFVDATDGNTEKNGLTIANTDIKIWKNTASALVSKNSGGAASMGAQGAYFTTFDHIDTSNLGPGVAFVHVTGALPVRVEFEVVTPAAYLQQTAAPGYAIAPSGIAADSFTDDALLAIADLVGEATWGALSADFNTAGTMGHLVQTLGVALGFDVSDIWAAAMVEPTSVPTWPTNPLSAIAYILASITHKVDNTGAEKILYAANGTAVLSRATISRSGGTLTKGADRIAA